jgi:predicted nuclease of predicted toxin-antitoxin system
MRFHLDENVDHAIADGLRRRAIDVTTSTDVGLLGAADESQVAFALEESRVIVTHDGTYCVSTRWALHTLGSLIANFPADHWDK